MTRDRAVPRADPSRGLQPGEQQKALGLGHSSTRSSYEGQRNLFWGDHSIYADTCLPGTGWRRGGRRAASIGKDGGRAGGRAVEKQGTQVPLPRGNQARWTSSGILRAQRGGGTSAVTDGNRLGVGGRVTDRQLLNQWSRSMGRMLPPIGGCWARPAANESAQGASRWRWLRRRPLRIRSGQLGGLDQSAASNEQGLRQSAASTTGLEGGYISGVGNGAVDADWALTSASYWGFRACER